MPAILLPLLKTAAMAFFSRLVGAAISEKLIAQLFFALAAWLVKHSDNALDDQALETIKKAYEGTSQQ